MNQRQKPPPLRIVRVVLLTDSRKSTRLLNDLDTTAYPVVLKLDRPASAFTLKLLSRIENPEIEVDYEAPDEVMLPHSSIEAVRSRFSRLSALIEAAGDEGWETERQALADDRAMRALVDEVNQEIANGVLK